MSLFITVGTFVGMLLHYPYIMSETLGNADGKEAAVALPRTQAKLAPVSKIAQCVGTLSNHLSLCYLMDLAGC
jgi:hypothetical protein